MKNKEVEDIRTRITEVAELFEKKEIKQRYSFEVLCDFIFDKAKRLYTKYDNLHKGSTNRRLERDHEELKQVLMKNNILASELTAKFSNLIGEQPSSEDGVEKFRLIAGKVEVAFLQVKQENNNLKERMGDLIKQVEYLQQNADFSNNDKDRRRFEVREEQARRELEHIRKDKEKLIH